MPPTPCCPRPLGPGRAGLRRGAGARPLRSGLGQPALAGAALELGLGNLDGADAQLRTARRLIRSPITEAQRAGPLFAGLAELFLCRGDLERAREQVAEAVPLVEASPGGAGLPDVAGWHITALAERERFEGRADPAAWAAAATAWERLGRPCRVAYASFRQAEALMAGDGDRDAAAEALRRAAAITGRLGARPLDAEVKALAQRARLRLDPDVTPPATAAPTPTEQLGLTPREAEVLTLVAAGRSNRQIAEALFISPKTASVHVSNILAKLGVATRVEAAAVAHRLGLD
jgi:DNA-binding CsgD family transcriptional regulator